MKLSLRSLLYDLVFGENCPICQRKAFFKYSPFCQDCWNSIKGLSSSKITTGHFSKDFWKYVDSVTSFGAYEGVLREAIHCFKYQGIKRIGKELAKFLCSLPPIDVDLVIPVPLSREKLLKRGFNQSAILTRELARCWLKSYDLTILLKIRETADQASLDAKERYDNVKDSFEAYQSIGGLKIALIDDVLTTGATLGECAKVLKKAGAKEVHGITLARTV